MDWEQLGSEEKIEAAYRAATADMPPAYVEVLHQLEPGMRASQAFCLWRMARQALYRQEIRKGFAPDEAMSQAARRLLQIEL